MSPDVKGLDALEIYRKADEPAWLYPVLHDRVMSLARQDLLWILDRPPCIL